MKVDTLKAILNAFNCANPDPTRPNTNCVSIQKEGENVVIVATTGAILSEVIVHDVELSGLMEDQSFAVLPQDKHALKLLLKEWKECSEIPSKRDGSRIILGSTFQVAITSANGLGINFPEYKSLFKSSTEPVLTIGLDASLLLDLAKALKMEKRKGERLKLTFRGNSEAVHVAMEDQAIGLIMPWRLK